MTETPRLERGPAPGLVTHLAAALAAGLSATAILCAWNLLEMLLSARLYREDPGRALDLVFVCFTTYGPLVVVPVAALSLALFLLAPRRPGSAIPFCGGAATAASVLLMGISEIAPRGHVTTLASAPTLLDLEIVCLAAAICGVLGRHVIASARRSSRAARRVHASAVLLFGGPLAILAWQIARDHLGGRANRWIIASLALPALVVGLLAAFAAVRGVTGLAAAVRGARGRTVAMIGATVFALLVWGASGPRAAGPAPGPASASGRPSVIVIVSDALRADHVGCYGARRARTPSIDALAARGVRVERAYSSASWTMPATASLMTGLYPSGHGLITYHDHLRDDAEPIASVFRDAGYATAGFSANPILSERAGFSIGFTTWDSDLEPSHVQRHRLAPVYSTLVALHLWAPPERMPLASKVLDRAFAWLDANEGAPFFLYLHLIDTHDPYAPPPPYDEMYRSDSGSRFAMGMSTLNDIMMGKQRVAPADFERMQELYDGSVSYVDSQVGRLIAGLERRRLTEKTIVVFTADHGEELLDHGDLEHTRTLYDEVVRIPLVLSGPGIAGPRVFPGPLRQVDVAPSLLEAAGLTFPRKVEGDSFWRAMTGAEPDAPREALMELTYLGYRSPAHTVMGIRVGDLKLIGSSFYTSFESLPAPTKAPGSEASVPSAASGERLEPWRWELYDLAADPAETRDISAGRIHDVENLRGRLETWARRPNAARGGRAPMDDETRHRLKALGYID